VVVALEERLDRELHQQREIMAQRVMCTVAGLAVEVINKETRVTQQVIPAVEAVQQELLS
jgi:hypothetical protein